MRHTVTIIVAIMLALALGCEKKGSRAQDAREAEQRFKDQAAKCKTLCLELGPEVYFSFSRRTGCVCLARARETS